MKKMFLMLICCFLILGFTVGCGNKTNNNVSENSKEVTYIDDDHWNIVDSVTPDDDGIIKSDNSRPFTLIVVDDEEIVDCVNLDKDYISTNNEYKYYKISLLEFYLNCESSINHKGKGNKYNIKLLISISDPIKFLEASNILKGDTTSNLFKGFTTKDLFENSLKNELESNLNGIIIEYLEKNKVEFSLSFELEEYISNYLDEIIRPTKGIKIEHINLNLK